MQEKFIVGKEGVRTLLEMGGTWIEEIAPGSPDDPFAWWNDPEEVERRANAAAEAVRWEARKLRAR